MFIVQQGEVRITKIEAMPDEIESKEVEKSSSGRFIISHSEKGHHHTLSCDSMVLERVNNVPSGMRQIYAILENPGSLIQEAANSHDEQKLSPGIYRLDISREYDPFLEQARMVAD